jgi:hypothetical protein
VRNHNKDLSYTCSYLYTPWMNGLGFHCSACWEEGRETHHRVLSLQPIRVEFQLVKKEVALVEYFSQNLHPGCRNHRIPHNHHFGVITVPLKVIMLLFKTKRPETILRHCFKQQKTVNEQKPTDNKFLSEHIITDGATTMALN